jgi:hypothetical protein
VTDRLDAAKRHPLRRSDPARYAELAAEHGLRVRPCQQQLRARTCIGAAAGGKRGQLGGWVGKDLDAFVQARLGKAGAGLDRWGIAPSGPRLV